MKPKHCPDCEERRRDLTEANVTIERLRAIIERLREQLTQRPGMPVHGEARSRILRALNAESVDEGLATIKQLKQECKETHEAFDASICDLNRVTSECEQLTKWKRQVEADHRKVLADTGPRDEQHCSCVPHLRWAIEGLRAALERLVADETEPCRLDHHGQCQEHKGDKPCSVAEARAALATPPASECALRS